MSRDYDFDNDDYPTAVAAAAFAVHSLGESKARDQNATTYGPDTSVNKTRSKAENKEIQHGLRKSALKVSDETSKKNVKDPEIKVPTSTPTRENKISFSDTDEDTSKPGNPVFEIASEHSPSMGRPSTFADKHLNTNGRKSPETPLTKLDGPPIGRSTTQPIETTRPRPGDSMADDWEKEEMASIKERYERLRATIDNWEIKKKKKADRKLGMIEAKPDKSRAKAAQSHHNEIKRIKEIAGEARAHAEAKRGKEELKVKERANKIRSTGKLPATCLCF